MITKSVQKNQITISNRNRNMKPQVPVYTAKKIVKIGLTFFALNQKLMSQF